MIVRRLLAQTRARSTLIVPHRTLATAPKPPPFPTTPTCPAPTCPCAPTPQLPDGLEIDHTSPLNGAISSYAQHVLVCTGKDDWPSRIEEDNSGDNLAADLRELVGPRGKFSDVRPPACPFSMHNKLTPAAIPPHLHPEFLLPLHPPSQIQPRPPNLLSLPPPPVQIHPLPAARVLRIRRGPGPRVSPAGETPPHARWALADSP